MPRNKRRKRSLDSFIDPNVLDYAISFAVDRGYSAAQAVKVAKAAIRHTVVDEVYATIRTRQLDAARERARVAMRDLKVKYWIWTSARDGLTCAACWAMDGQKMTADQKLNDHHNGRCVKSPVAPSWEEILPGAGGTDPVWNTGKAAFDGLTTEEKQAILGKGKYAAYERGEFGLPDLVSRYRDKDTGERRIREKPLKDLRS